MEKTFESCMTLKDDVRELIPEFYYFPEMFKNLNNLNLAQDLLDANGEKFIINDVELPLWSEKKISNFIVQMRNVLENNKIKINKWIDIIFGNLQRGEKAEEIHNLFQAQSYEGMVKIDKIKDLDMRDAMMRLVEVGVTPMQIFDKESKSKIEEKKLMKNNIYSLAKGLFLDDKKCKLNKFNITSNNYKSIYHKLYENYKLTDNRDYQEEIYPQIISIKCINPKNLKIFTNKNSWYFIKISNHDNKPIFEEKNINTYQNNSSEFAPSFQMCISNLPYVIYNNEKYIIKGGFWDSHLEINSLFNEHEKKDKEKEKEERIATNIFEPMYGPIEIMKMTSDEKFLFCGSKYGNIIIYGVDGPNLKVKKVLYDHSDAITSISINENLNMFATTSRDGYINLYILPSFTIVRSILLSVEIDYKLNFENFEKNKKDEFIYASDIFLSSTPLPCCTIYLLENHIFKTYTINGELIYQEEESEYTGNIKCPIIFKNILFNDFLIYGTEDGFIKIRSFPDMKLINAIKPFEGQEIKALELSPDKRFCYAWSHREKIVVIKDINTSTGFEVKDESNEVVVETLADKIIAE
jgi:WD40 repeat protein